MRKEGVHMHKNQLLFVIGLISAVVVTVFAMANAKPVVINLLFTKFEASQALLIFFSAAMGAIIVTFMGLIRHFRLTGELRTLRKENEKLRNQIKFNEDEKKVSAEKIIQEPAVITSEEVVVEKTVD